MKTFAAIITNILFFFCFTSQAQDTFTVEASVKGSGEHYVAILIDNGDQFPAATATSVTQKGTKSENGASFSFKDVTLGTYSILVFHDENNNGTLDMEGNMPSEAFGYSNYIMMGPPTWKNCSFEVNEDKSIEVKLYQF